MAPFHDFFNWHATCSYQRIMSKTKIAISAFGSQVSPRCDCAPEILFVEFENGKIVSRRTVPMEGMTPLQRIRMISASGTTLMVCGAIPVFYQRMIEALGIKIMYAQGTAIDALLERLKEKEFPLAVLCVPEGQRKYRHGGCPWGSLQSLAKSNTQQTSNKQAHGGEPDGNGTVTGGQVQMKEKGESL